MTRDDRTDDILRALGDAAPRPPPPSAALEALLATAGPVATRQPRRDAALIGGLSAVYGAVLVIATTVRRDFDHLPLSWRIWFGAMWALGFVALLGLALLPRRGEVTPRALLAGGSGAALAALFVGAGLGLTAEARGLSLVPAGGLGTFVRYAWPCLLLGSITAIMPVALGMRALRGAVPVGARWVGAGLGAAGGALGGLVLHFHCPIAQGLHVGLAHGGVAVLAAAVAALVAPSQLEP